MPSEAQIIAQERQALMNLMDTDPHRIPRREVDENILIASWNIAQFSNKKKKRALQYIADICERFDIVALQEVKSDLRGLARLQKMLPGHYEIIVSDTTGNHERLAFLYDQRTVTSTGLVCEIGFHGTIAQPAAFQFNRMPYCASFRAGRFDFVIVSVHITEGSSQGAVGLDLREREIDELVKSLKKRANAEAGRTFDRDFFVVGDFNIQTEDDRFFEALTQGSDDPNDEDPKFTMPEDMDDLGTNFSRTKTFDKIAWLPRPNFEFADRFGVVPFGDVLYKEQGQTEEAAKDEVSDHLPLWAEFRVNALTQELDQILNE